MGHPRDPPPVPGPGGRRHAPMAYVVVASLLGAVALLSGIMTLVSASETMLAILVAATVALWVLATIRHAMTSQGHPSDQPVREPTHTTA